MKARIGVISLSVIMLFAGVFCVVVFLLNYSYSAPDFVRDSQSRLQSYLTYSYGPVNCTSVKINEESWDVVCDGGYQKQSFEYITHLAEDEKSYKGEYYLLAKNNNARKSSREGLMVYLDIR